jgi:hypothetical protein
MGFSVFPSSSFDSYKSPVVRHTLNSSGNISVPSGTNLAYAVVFSGGSGGNGSFVRGAPLYGTGDGSAGVIGNLAIGLTPIANSATVGAGGGGGTGGNSSTQPAGAGGGAGGAGGSSIFGSIISGSTTNFVNTANATVAQPRNSTGDGRFAADGLNANPGTAGNGGSGQNGTGGAGSSGAVIVIY